MRDLNADEKVSLFTFMLTKCPTICDHVAEYGNFDDATDECAVRHVIRDNAVSTTVLVFWAGGNDYVNVFHFNKATRVWRVACDQECN